MVSCAWWADWTAYTTKCEDNVSHLLLWVSTLPLSGHTDFILRLVISCEDLFTLRVFWVSRSEDRLTNTWGTQSSSLREPLGAEGWTPDQWQTGVSLLATITGHQREHAFVCKVFRGIIVSKCTFRGSEKGAHAEHKQRSIVDFWIFFLWRERKKGGFRGRVDECVDGGILIGVILTWQGPGSLMNQNVSARRWRWRAAHCGSDTHVRGWGCWGSSVTPH